MSFISKEKKKFLENAFGENLGELLAIKVAEYQNKFDEFKKDPVKIKENFKDFRSDTEFFSSLLTGWLTEDLMQEYLNEKIYPDKIELDGVDSERSFSQKNVLANPDYKVLSQENSVLGYIEMKTWISIKKDVFLKEYSVNHVKEKNGLFLYYFLKEEKILLLSYPQILQFKKIQKWKKPGFLITSQYMERKAKDIKNFKKFDLFKFYE